MNPLCSVCPLDIFCNTVSTTGPDTKLVHQNADLRAENSILKDRLLENGLDAGASIYSTGQRMD